MKTIWKVFLEVFAFIDSAPTKGELGFINVVLFAEDAEGAEKKARSVLSEYGWEIIGVESVTVIDPDEVDDEEFAELIDDVIANPTHVRLGTLHSYKSN